MNAHNNAVDDGAQRVWRTNAGNYYHVLDLVITDPEVISGGGGDSIS